MADCKGVNRMCDMESNLCFCFSYILLEDDTAEIVGYDGDDDDLVIPSELDGYPVTAIGDSAFYYCEGLYSVVIPEGVTTIGKEAFRECGDLTSVAIPDSVTHIGDVAFLRVPI